MVEPIKSWIKENQTLVIFLGAQAIAFGIGATSIVAYYVRMETRVSIMETRGAEFTVEKIGQLDKRITVIEQRQQRNEAQIERIIDNILKGK